MSTLFALRAHGLEDPTRSASARICDAQASGRKPVISIRNAERTKSGSRPVILANALRSHVFRSTSVYSLMLFNHLLFGGGCVVLRPLEEVTEQRCAGFYLLGGQLRWVEAAEA